MMTQTSKTSGVQKRDRILDRTPYYFLLSSNLSEKRSFTTLEPLYTQTVTSNAWRIYDRRGEPDRGTEEWGECPPPLPSCPVNLCQELRSPSSNTARGSQRPRHLSRGQIPTSVARDLCESLSCASCLPGTPGRHAAPAHTHQGWAGGHGWSDSARSIFPLGRETRCRS